MRILLAVDGSKSANHATDTLIKHIGWLHDKPHIDVLAAHLPVGTFGTIHGSVINEQARKQYYQYAADQALAEPKQMLTKADLRFQTHTRIGDPADEICRFANENGSDMIYMGTRGMNLITSFVVGSTSQKVLHLAKIPVVLVPFENREDAV